MPITIKQNVLNTPAPQSFGCVPYNPLFGNSGKEKPISCGIFAPLRYPFDVFVLVLEGQFSIEDPDRHGKIDELTAGDVVRVDEGTTVKWSSRTRGKGFYVSLRPFGQGPIF